MTVDTQKLRELLEKAIQRAYYLGQEYWRLADSESWSDNRRSFDTQDKFDALRSETVSVAGVKVSALLDEIDALRAELQARQWQPIETAPKDSTVWAYNGEQGRMRWIEGEGYALWAWEDELLSDVDPMPIQPTSWMPLPPAPPQGDGA